MMSGPAKNLAHFLPQFFIRLQNQNICHGLTSSIQRKIIPFSSFAQYFSPFWEIFADLDRILKEGKWAFIRSIESGAALGGKLENVDHFAKLNFKMMTLTWNGINELGSGFQSEMGLTDFGKAAVRRMEEVGMIVDCSHLNDAGFEDLLNCSTKPFVASHSNLRSLCSHSGNIW